MIRLLVADDEALVRECIVAHLKSEDSFIVVAQASDGQDAVDQAIATQPDVAVLDALMPGLDGFGAAAGILANVAECKVILLSAHARPGYVSRALSAGASGFVLRSDTASSLVSAIRDVYAGQRVVNQDLAAQSLALGRSPLTARETGVLAHTLSHHSTSAIAQSLNLAEGSIRNILSAAMVKLGATSRVEASRIAEENGWL